MNSSITKWGSFFISLVAAIALLAIPVQNARATRSSSVELIEGQFNIAPKPGSSASVEQDKYLEGGKTAWVCAWSVHENVYWLRLCTEGYASLKSWDEPSRWIPSGLIRNWYQRKLELQKLPYEQWQRIREKETEFYFLKRLVRPESAILQPNLPMRVWYDLSVIHESRAAEINIRSIVSIPATRADIRLMPMKESDTCEYISPVNGKVITLRGKKFRHLDAGSTITVIGGNCTLLSPGPAVEIHAEVIEFTTEPGQ